MTVIASENNTAECGWIVHPNIWQGSSYKLKTFRGAALIKSYKCNISWIFQIKIMK